MKLNFSKQIFEKHSNINFHDNPSCGSRRGRRDGHEEANSRFWRFWERAKKTKNPIQKHPVYVFMPFPRTNFIIIIIIT
jgi:hypothetical protein